MGGETCQIVRESPKAVEHVGWTEAGALYWPDALVMLLLWMIPALLSLYVKHRITDFFAAAVQVDSVQKLEVASQIARDYSRGLTAWEKLSFFRTDFLIGFAAFPACLLLLRRCLPRRAAIAIAVLLASAATFILSIQLRAYVQVGEFLPAALIERAIIWIWHEPAGLSFLLRESGTLIKGCVTIAVAVPLVLWSRSNLARLTRSRMWWKAAVAAMVVSELAVTVVAWVPAVPNTSYHRSMLIRAVSALHDAGGVATAEFGALKGPELARRYREMTLAPAPSHDVRYWGKDANANVIFVVLETASYRALPLDDRLDDFPNLQRLRQHAFVGLSHRTTYPNSKEAFFSLLTSWYTDDGVDWWIVPKHYDLAPPNIMRTLGEHGYATGAYSPYNDDNDMYKVLGVPHRVPPGVPHGGFFSPARGWEEAWSPKGRIARDFRALEMMERDITTWLEHDRRFAVAFLPQITHAPSFDIKTPQPDPVKRTRALLAYEDGWMGELINLLQRHRALDNTIIIVVGDHGVRHRWEDPALPVGTADDYTFHVPLLIYAPKVLDSPQPIGWVTSHIDVVPTVLDLLGVADNRDFEQGTPIWNPELGNRTTYFFAWHFQGVDGYYAKGKFYTWRHLSDSVYMNVHPHFEANTQVPASSPEFQEVRRSISRMVALQHVWLAQFYSEKSALHSHIY